MNQKNKAAIRQFSLILFTAAVSLLAGCRQEKPAHALPMLGERVVLEKEDHGLRVGDTVYTRIPDFAFINQDSQQVTSQTFAGKIYVTDFFFTTCPSICPKMKSQMLRIYEKFKDNPQVLLLSHSIDPQHDTVAVLRDYARRLQVSSQKWHFVTGDKDAIYDMALKYMVSALEDSTAPGGILHSGHFVLVDANRHVRGIYEGTDAESVNQLMQDIPVLLQENENGGH
jgi:protein SCO1/2